MPKMLYIEVDEDEYMCYTCKGSGKENGEYAIMNCQTCGGKRTVRLPHYAEWLEQNG